MASAFAVSMSSDAGVVVWVTGLPSSGKSTLARALHARLRERNIPSCVLDGDEVRQAMVPTPGYTSSEREAFYGTLAGLAALLSAQGLVVLVPATANRAAFRERARSLSPRFIEVFVDVELGECARRDAKGLYAAARVGLRGLPGQGEPFERPSAPDVIASGGKDSKAILKTIELVEANP